MKKILFISHDASRTGAPILLLNLAKLIFSFDKYEVNFLLKNGGVLEKKFNDLAPTYYLYQQNKSKFDFIKEKIFKSQSLLEDKQFLEQYDYIISNTITNGDVLGTIRANYKGHIISYIHELEVASKTYTTLDRIETVIKCSDKFWVPSTLVKDFLLREFKIFEDKVLKMPYYIENKKSFFLKEKDTIKSFIVGGCGTIDWRKGPDLFIQIANELFLKRPKASIIFKWKGAVKGLELMRLEYQIKLANLAGKVLFELSSDNLDSFYEEIDLFLLTSREDPYPLVVLEAAQFAKPSICFYEVCGSRDFITDSDGGFVVPFLDISAVANSILLFYDDPKYKREKGENARRYLLTTHSNENYIYNKLKESLLQ